MKITRREFSRQSLATLTTAGLSSLGMAKAAPLALSKMGIASTSFMGAQIGAGGPPPPAGQTAPPRQFAQRDAFEFLEKCHALGAGGIQTSLNGDLNKLRARADELGMYIEGMVSIPRDGDLSRLEKQLTDAKSVGVKVMRAAMLSGRRYESFATLVDWKKWVDGSYEAIRLAMPVIEKHKVVVALENHKDWTLEDFQKLLKTYQSEYLQVCLDFGNNISLLDDPMEVIEGLAPYAKSTHIKDMSVKPYEDGFLLSEVVLGQGLLDLGKIVAVIQKANPQAKFSLEMITRDPLKVPCLTKAYWEVFPDRNGKHLAQTFKLVQAKSSKVPLPTISNLSTAERQKFEEDNVKGCLQYVNEKQLLG